MCEASETQTWFDFCFAYKYISRDLFDELNDAYEMIIRKPNAMERKAETFCF
jgi:hypothetical protein